MMHKSKNKKHKPKNKKYREKVPVEFSNEPQNDIAYERSATKQNKQKSCTVNLNKKKNTSVEKSKNNNSPNNSNVIALISKESGTTRHFKNSSSIVKTNGSSEVDLILEKRLKIIQYQYSSNRPFLRILENSKGTQYSSILRCSNCGCIESHCYTYKRHNWGEGRIALCGRCKTKIMNRCRDSIRYSNKWVLLGGRFDNNSR